MNRSQEIAYNTLNYFRSGEGFSAGSFGVALLDAAGSADSMNLAKLALGFPEEIAAYMIGAQHSDGLDVLRAQATGGAA